MNPGPNGLFPLARVAPSTAVLVAAVVVPNHSDLAGIVAVVVLRLPEKAVSAGASTRACYSQT